MKVAIVTDSNSGITQRQGEEAGIYVVPMPFMMAEETFYEDISLTQKDFYEKLEGGVDISTSQPSPADLLDLWNGLLEEYEEIVHIPMSSGLSSACQTAIMLAEDYEGKVFVVNNQRISVTQRQSVLEAKRMANEGMTAAAIKEKLEETKMESTIYITLDTLEYLKKGGRITPAAALLGTFLRIKPVLTIQGEKLDAFAKARTMKQAKTMMITAAKKDMEERFGDPEGNRTSIAIAHSNNEAAAMEFKKELEEVFPNTGEIYVDNLSLSVSCHIGPGALAIACTKRLDV
ncbi:MULTISPECIES: DegV family protein [Clostridia]|uniref:Dihydroxyacetone kinase n=1 Tax=Lacrimispora celerecrescens TaxID=29354 RepID=A0A084JM84_9FIRM|nr:MULTISPECIES: DegV family protein [Clostridia]KEZ90068.1 dihydroxyacetone kinase [Lacrimispora celerecrescens]MBW4846971.1 DegV family protein [Lachnospiraceae bacterium]MSS08819.1 DegV family protein [Clostridium sp. WB02_MRS01]CUX60108.1 DegV domain-containing protein [Clostridium sp. C105KSO15]